MILMFGFLLNKVGFTQSVRSDLYTITENVISVGKHYAEDEMFKAAR